MVFTIDGFFEVAIESWPEWDLNPRPLIYIYIYIFDMAGHVCPLNYLGRVIRSAFTMKA